MKKRRNPFTGALEDDLPPQTYLCPPEGRPDRETISAQLGFHVPLAFVDFVQWVHEQAGGDPYRCLEVHARVLGVGSGGPKSRYDATPPELFPIGVPGVDGVHYGYIVHAPELERDDYPIGHFCPMDSDGVSIAGADTLQGLAAIANWWSDPGGWRAYPPLEAARLKFQGVEDVEGAGERLPEVPEGWKFEPTSDGIGVLAPEEFFGSALVPIDPFARVETFESAGGEAMSHGRYADALYYLREGYWAHWTAHPFDLCEQLCEVHRKLNRYILADIVANRIAKWKSVT